MEWYPSLYKGNSIRASVSRLKKLIEHRYPAATRYYLICLPQANHNQLEIYQVYQFWKPIFNTGSNQVIGVGRNYSEAMGLVKTILAESIQAGFKYDMRAFIEQRWQEMRAD